MRPTFCRFASRAVAVAKTQNKDAVAARLDAEHSVAHRASQSVEQMGDRVGAKVQKVFAGSSTTTAYAPDSAVLRKHLSPEREPPPSTSESPARSRQSETTVAAAPPAPLSVGELEKLSVGELKQMLTVRGVESPGSGMEKKDLAKWVHQHQHLPMKSTSEDAPVDSYQPAASSKSLAELRRMPIKELHDELDRRGVGRGSATDKAELAKWVWQHQDLPAIRTEQRNEKKSWKWGWGAGEGGSKDCPKDEPKTPEQEKLEGEKTELLEEGDGPQKLLEGTIAEESTASTMYRKFMLTIAGVGSVVVGIVIALALNDVRTASIAAEERNKCRAAE